MGSVSNSLTSTATSLTNTPVTANTTGSSSSNTNTNTTGIFTGTSAYSKDLQGMIDRAVAIASLPINLMTDQQTALKSQSDELTLLDTKFTALQTAIQGITTALGGASFQSASSVATVATATLSDGAAEGIYNIKVDNPGVTATSLSTAWNQPALAAGQTATYGLVLDNQEYTFTTSDNSAQGVAAAIRAKFGSQVDALAVNVNAATNDWRISLQSPTLGPVSLNLIKVPTLQTQNSYAISQTTDPWVTNAGSYNLVVNGTNYAFTAATGDAADVAAQINSLATDKSLNVKAAVVGTGIQLVGTAGGTGPLDIQFSATDLQTQASASSETTATWDATADAAGTKSQYTLLVGSSKYTLTAGDNSAATVAAAINSNVGNLVTATVVDWSGNGTDYRIALQAKTGTSPLLDLQKTASLQAQIPTGYAVSQTTKTWPPGTDNYSIVVGAQTFALNPLDATAQQVADDINSTAVANALNVNATVVDVGTGGASDLRIRLQSTTAGPMVLQIQNGSLANLQTDQTSVTSQTTANWNATDDAGYQRSQYSLVVGANSYNFVVGDNKAATVAAAINSQFGSMVNATVIDLGTGGSHDYRIALQDKTGTGSALDIQRASAKSLQDQKTTGALAEYELNGAAKATSNSASVSVANGVKLNLLTTGTTSITVTRSPTALSKALATFTDAYNAAVDEVGKQRGQTAGPLQGQAILSVLSKSLSGLSLYGSSTGSIATLYDLGMDLGKDGHITYDGGVQLMLANYSNSTDLTSFFGSATGGGFLKAATDALTNVEDDTYGLLKTAETDTQTGLSNIAGRIATKQVQVYELQTHLTSQMAAADALIASMEQQYSYISQMFAAQQTASQMYK